MENKANKQAVINAFEKVKSQIKGLQEENKQLFAIIDKLEKFKIEISGANISLQRDEVLRTND